LPTAIIKHALLERQCQSSHILDAAARLTAGRIRESTLLQDAAKLCDAVIPLATGRLLSCALAVWDDATEALKEVEVRCPEVTCNEHMALRPCNAQDAELLPWAHHQQRQPIESLKLCSSVTSLRTAGSIVENPAKHSIFSTAGSVTLPDCAQAALADFKAAAAADPTHSELRRALREHYHGDLQVLSMTSQVSSAAMLPSASLYMLECKLSLLLAVYTCSAEFSTSPTRFTQIAGRTLSTLALAACAGQTGTV